EATIMPFADDQGSIEQFLSIRTDITHIKAIEESLRQQQGLLKTLNEVTTLLLETHYTRLDSAVEQILARFCRQIGAVRAGFWQLCADDRQIVPARHWAIPSGAGMPLPSGPIPLADFTLAPLRITGECAQYSPWQHTPAAGRGPTQGNALVIPVNR